MPWLTRDFCRELLAFSSVDWHSHIAYIASSQPQGYFSKKVVVGLCSEKNLFYVADTQLYMLPCWSVDLLVRWSMVLLVIERYVTVKYCCTIVLQNSSYAPAQPSATLSLYHCVGLVFYATWIFHSHTTGFYVVSLDRGWWITPALCNFPFYSVLKDCNFFPSMPTNLSILP